MKRLSLVCLAPLLLVGCEASKSTTPLSPSVAGPIPGIEISAPKTLEPVSLKIPVTQQPVTLLIENASSTGPRPLTLTVEVATDVNFASKLFERAGIAPGEGGRTALRLPDSLPPGRSYFWRVRAEDGANTGPFSAAASFEVFTPVVLGEPILLSPIHNEQVDTRRPRFTFQNSPRTGPVGAISYILEFSNSPAFAPAFIVGPVPEGANQTTVDAPQDAPYDIVLFWRVRATDGTNNGFWSDTHDFRTPDTPRPVSPSPSPTPTPSPNGQNGHIAAGGATEDRAKSVVFGTYNEFPSLHAVFGSEGEAVGAADQLLRRTLWHLNLAGFEAAGQKNPSGAISSDKICIKIGGQWRLFDIYSLGTPGKATTVQWFEIASNGANPYARPVIPD
jgi:hypothetical protein